MLRLVWWFGGLLAFAYFWFVVLCDVVWFVLGLVWVLICRFDMLLGCFMLVTLVVIALVWCG